MYPSFLPSFFPEFNGFNINAVDYRGRTALHIAATAYDVVGDALDSTCPHVAVVKRLLEAGASVEAVMKDSEKAKREMAQENGDAKRTCRYEGATALYIASNNGDLHTGKPSQAVPDDGCVEIVRLLLDAGSPVNKACCIGKQTAIGLERAFAAPVTNLHHVVRPGKGMSPLFVAAAKGNLKVVMLLIEAGAAVDQAASDAKVDGVGIMSAKSTRYFDFGYTPIYVASKLNHAEIVTQLLMAGATGKVRRGEKERERGILPPCVGGGVLWVCVGVM